MGRSITLQGISATPQVGHMKIRNHLCKLSGCSCQHLCKHCSLSQTVGLFICWLVDRLLRWLRMHLNIELQNAGSSLCRLFVSTASIGSIGSSGGVLAISRLVPARLRGRSPASQSWGARACCPATSLCFRWSRGRASRARPSRRFSERFQRAFPFIGWSNNHFNNIHVDLLYLKHKE